MNNLIWGTLRILPSYFLLLSSLSAQPSEDIASQKVLGEVIDHGRSMRDFQADFVYELQSPDGTYLQRDGRILYMDHKYAILFQDQEIYIDGETQWIYSPETNEVFITEYEVGGTNVMELLFQLFAFKISVSYLGEEMLRNKIHDKINIVVADHPNITYHQAYAWVGKRPRMFNKVTFIDRRRNTTTFEFVDISTNRGFTLSDFQFDVFAEPEVKVRDLRE